MRIWGSYDVRPPISCGWCGQEFVPVKKFEAYCSAKCKTERREWYNKAYFSDEVKKVERSIRRKLKETPEQRAHKAKMAKERYDRYGAFITLHARRAAGRVPVFEFSAQQLELRMSMFGFRCWICSDPFEAIDHVKPMAAGGAHMLGNLRPICRECNGRKWMSWPLSEVARKFSIWADLTEDFTVSRWLLEAA